MKNGSPSTEAGSLIAASGICKTYQTPDHSGRLVIDNIDFALAEGEIVAILGKSGSGKSTFLRILAGLTVPSGGAVRYRGHEVHGPAQGIAMVFQTFALFPWLTVLGNVELGLEAQGVPRGERRQRAIAAIDLIGLDGLQNRPIPRNCPAACASGWGSPARWWSIPTCCCSTSRSRRSTSSPPRPCAATSRISGSSAASPPKSIIIVSHNIEEAVELADRIIIFGSDPAVIRADIPVALARPRDVNTPTFRRIVDEVYTLLTTVPGREGGEHRRARPETIDVAIACPMPRSSSSRDCSMRCRRRPAPSRAPTPRIAESEHLSTDGSPLIGRRAADLEFHVGGGDIETMPAGRSFAVKICAPQADLRGTSAATFRSSPISARCSTSGPATAPPKPAIAGSEDHLKQGTGPSIQQDRDQLGPLCRAVRLRLQ